MPGEKLFLYAQAHLKQLIQSRLFWEATRVFAICCLRAQIQNVGDATQCLHDMYGLLTESYAKQISDDHRVVGICELAAKANFLRLLVVPCSDGHLGIREKEKFLSTHKAIQTLLEQELGNLSNPTSTGEYGALWKHWEPLARKLSGGAAHESSHSTATRHEIVSSKEEFAAATVPKVTKKPALPAPTSRVSPEQQVKTGSTMSHSTLSHSNVPTKRLPLALEKTSSTTHLPERDRDILSLSYEIRQHLEHTKPPSSEQRFVKPVHISQLSITNVSQPNRQRERARTVSDKSIIDQYFKEVCEQYRRARDGSAFFVPGRLFAVVSVERNGMPSHGEDLGKIFDPGPSDWVMTGRRHENSKAMGEDIRCYARRMIVVQDGKNFSWCLPVGSYAGKGLLTEGLPLTSHQSHAVLHNIDTMPLFSEEESTTTKSSIAVQMIDAHGLRPGDCINFAMPLLVSRRSRVKDLGMVAPLYLPVLLQNTRDELKNQKLSIAPLAGDAGTSRQAEMSKAKFFERAGSQDLTASIAQTSKDQISQLRSVLDHEKEISENLRTMYKDARVQVEATQTQLRAHHSRFGDMKARLFELNAQLYAMAHREVDLAHEILRLRQENKMRLDQSAWMRSVFMTLHEENKRLRQKSADTQYGRRQQEAEKLSHENEETQMESRLSDLQKENLKLRQVVADQWQNTPLTQENRDYETFRPRKRETAWPPSSSPTPTPILKTLRARSSSR